jgi:hypothetical protein
MQAYTHTDMIISMLICIVWAGLMGYIFVHLWGIEEKNDFK